MAIYLDHAATSPVRREVLRAMHPVLAEVHGNPSSIHASGRRARQALDEARETIAGIIGASPREIVLTSGGSESDNLAIKGAGWAGSARGRHIVTTAVEHKAVLNACAVMERSGFEVTVLPVDRTGRVDPADLAAVITERTVLVSVIHASNEVGTIQPVAEIGAICRNRGVPFHTDAVQAAAHLPIDVDAMNASLVSLGAHKLGGPKGVGALFVRRRTQVLPQVHGGSQERQRRAGTENVAGAVGFATALRLAIGDEGARAAETARLVELRDRLVAGLTSVDGVELTGHRTERLPNSASVVVDGVEGGDLVAALDLAGVEASTGSACTSGSTEPSHVLLAMGIDPHLAHGSLRMTLGPETTSDEIDRALEVTAATIGRLRGTRSAGTAMAGAS